MERVVALGRRVLPRGWRDFGLQLGIWFGFYFSYLAVRHLTDRDPAKAIVERPARDLARAARDPPPLRADCGAGRRLVATLLTAAAWTYWNSEFTVIGLTLLWVYLRRHERFIRFRNTILLANLIGLIGFWLMPTAPPWMFPGKGFVDGVNHSSALLQSLGQLVRGDAEPARRGRADRRLLPRLHARGRSGRRRSGRSGRSGSGSA